MKLRTCFLFLFVCTLITAPTPALASDVTIPNTFQSGTPAVAAEVNANFTAVETAVDDNDSRIAALEAALATLQATVTSQETAISTLQATVTSQETTISTLQATVTSQETTVSTLKSDLAAVYSSNVMALEPYLIVDASGDPRGPLVQLDGVNLQIVNGEGSTNTINGLGNLIIGYDEVNTNEQLLHCSDGQYHFQADCKPPNIWSHSHKSGSHYLVTGTQNNYSQYGGIVAGARNFSTLGYNTVTGGFGNTASAQYSSVSGGYGNTASGMYSSVSGGQFNTANGGFSSVSGGNNHNISGQHDWQAGNLFEDN